MSNRPEDPDPATELYRHRTETVSVDRGDGPPVVFSHGTLMDWTMFEPQLDALSGDYRTVAYQNRARTDRWQGPYDLDDLADDCRALMDAKGIDSAVLVGMSMGGFMALRFAMRYPDALDGIVLVDSMAQPHDDSDVELYEQWIEGTREAGDVQDQMADLVSGQLFGATTLEENEALVEHWKDRWKTYPGEAIYWEVNSWLHREDMTDRLSDVDVPVLVVHGEEDASIAPEEAEPVVEHVDDARMVTVPEAGHSSNLENPEPATAAIREFLDDVY